MVSYRTRGIYTLTLLAQVVTVTLVFWLWLPFSQGKVSFAGVYPERYAIYNAMIGLGLIVGSKGGNLLKNDFWNCNRLAARQTLVAFGFLGVFVIASKDKAISRVFLFSLMPLAYATLALCNRYLPSFIAKRTFKGAHEERVILVGPSKKVPFLQSWIESKEGIGFQTVGILCDDSPATTISGIKVLGGLDDLERTIMEWSITQVVVVEFPLFSNVLSNCSSVCERLGVRFLVFCDFESRFHHAVTIFEDEGLRFISLRQEPLEDPFNRLMKRLLDIAVSVPVILIILPFTTALVWLIHKLQSPGPVFHKQPRAGR